MEGSEVRQIATSGSFLHTSIRGHVVETHISWVILSGQYAFKIKKPVKLPFLDFSTLELRKSYCEKEFSLNLRFSDIYLGVQPIHFENGHWHIGPGDGRPIDYCVVMKRMSETKRLDHRLRARVVTKTNIQVLAKTVAKIHINAPRVYTPFNFEVARSTFNDISTIRDFVSKHIAEHFADVIDQAMASSEAFLLKHQGRMQQRIDSGLKRDVHGDLHSGNIFLYSTPILFDCLEFNDRYRQIDVLDEVAFLCMDLEAFHFKQLSQAFLKAYSRRVAVFQSAEDHDIFRYFKGVRANIRAKVHALRAMQAGTQEDLSLNVSDAANYLMVMDECVNRQS